MFVGVVVFYGITMNHTEFIYNLRYSRAILTLWSCAGGGDVKAAQEEEDDNILYLGVFIYSTLCLSFLICGLCGIFQEGDLNFMPMTRCLHCHFRIL